jgi:hypothetical protein
VSDGSEITLTAHIKTYLLEEDGRRLHVGEVVECCLIYSHEPDGMVRPATALSGLKADATPWTWEHHFLDQHPTRLTIGPAILYWGAPEPTVGEVELNGTISWADSGYEVPEDLPANVATIERLRMETWTYRTQATGGSVPVGMGRLSDVQVTDLPQRVLGPGQDSPIWSGVVVDLRITSRLTT